MRLADQCCAYHTPGFLGAGLGGQVAGAPFGNQFAGLPLHGEPLGLYDGRPWFLPLVGAWYKLLDAVS